MAAPRASKGPLAASPTAAMLSCLSGACRANGGAAALQRHTVVSAHPGGMLLCSLVQMVAWGSVFLPGHSCPRTAWAVHRARDGRCWGGSSRRGGLGGAGAALLWGDAVPVCPTQGLERSGGQPQLLKVPSRPHHELLCGSVPSWSAPWVRRRLLQGAAPTPAAQLAATGEGPAPWCSVAHYGCVELQGHSLG